MLSNSFSAEYAVAVGVSAPSPTKRGSNAYHGTAFYDFNNDGRTPTYNQTLAGVERGDRLSKTHDNRWGGLPGRTHHRQQAVLLRQLRGLENKAIQPGRATVPTQAMERVQRHGAAPEGSADRCGVPDQTIPR